MNVIYLAGPMTGIKNFNFEAFNQAAYTLRKQGHIVFNPAEHDGEKYGEDIFNNPTGDPKVLAELGFSLDEALAADTQFICLKADTIAMLPGWENSKGARAEHALAFALGRKIIYLGPTHV